MEFQFEVFELGYLYGGEVFEVTLSRDANVFLLDTYNYRQYEKILPFKGIGGHVTVSPYRVTVPSSGRWYITVDLGFEGGLIGCDVREIKPYAERIRKDCHFNLPDGTTVYYDEFSDGRVRLVDVIRDGMSRCSGGQVFSSLNELARYCKRTNWSRY